MIREQIVTVKVRWDDNPHGEVCEATEQEGCCGVGACENYIQFDPADNIVIQHNKCCVLDGSHVEVLQVSPEREVLSEDSF